MKLVRIDDNTYVNVGDGNITSVIGGTTGAGRLWAAINFVSGKQLDLPGRRLRDVVMDLEADRL